MANGSQLPEGFVLDEPPTGLPPGFVLDQPVTQETQVEAPQGMAQEAIAIGGGGQPGMFQRMQQAFTGEQQMTPQMEALPEIGDAPELNRLSVPAFKASLGLLTTGETGPLQAILKQQFGEDVEFTQDEKGNPIVNFPSGSYALNRPGMSPQDVARGVFDMLAFTPSGRAASIPAAAGRAAATQAAIEGAEAGVGGEFDPERVALAGAVGGLAKGAEEAVGAGIRMVRGRPVSEVVEAGQQAGIPIMTSDIRQPATFAGRMAQQTGEKIPVLGTGGRREVQQAARERAVRGIADRYGEFSYQAIVDSLKAQKNKVKTAAGKVLERTGRQLDDVGEIPLTSTRSAIRNATDELQKPGVIQSSQAMEDLNTLVRSLDEAPQTFSMLKENRTAFREILKGADKAERSQLTSRAKSLLQNVDSAMKKDMDAIAKQNLSPQDFLKWQKANKLYANEAVKLTKSRLKNVLDKGDVTPESVQNLLFSQKPSEVRTLYRSLDTTGKQNARSAIISKVINDLNRRASQLTPSTFANEMKKYGVQVSEFFKGEEKRRLNGLLKALNATRRAQEAGVTTPTGQQILGAGSALALFTEPASTLGAAGTVGGLSRLYESSLVRNALLRLDSVPKGSAGYEKALREVFSALNAAAQTTRSELEETQTRQLEQ